MARSPDFQFEDLARASNKSDWRRLPGKAQRYQYIPNPAITLSRRHKDAWPGTRPADKWQSSEFDTLGELLQFVAQFGRSLYHVGFINAHGTFKTGYSVNEVEGWRNIAPTRVFAAMGGLAFYQDCERIADGIFQTVDRWNLQWKRL